MQSARCKSHLGTLHNSGVRLALARPGSVAEKRGVARSRLPQCRCTTVDRYATSPLFSDEFKQVLQSALAREGSDALTRGATSDDEERASAAEDVLETAIVVSRNNLQRLHNMHTAIKSAMEAEKKQLERLQFGLQTLKSDSAYLRCLEKRLREEQQRHGY